MSVPGLMAIDADLLRSGEIRLVGRLVEASNATLFVAVATDAGEVEAVYKPTAGEAPLWDFPDGTLAFREVAAYQVAQLLEWDLVPTTVLRDGPFGPGMVQEWITIDDEVDLIALAQSDDLRLAHLALFDALINNTDRKIGHLLPTPDGRVLGCDHGVAFHVDDKLRTVLWQFRGESIPPQWLDDLVRLEDAHWRSTLEPLLHGEEIDALLRRRDALLDSGRYPQPSPHWPAVPFPPI